MCLSIYVSIYVSVYVSVYYSFSHVLWCLSGPGENRVHRVLLERDVSTVKSTLTFVLLIQYVSGPRSLRSIFFVHVSGTLLSLELHKVLTFPSVTPTWFLPPSST